MSDAERRIRLSLASLRGSTEVRSETRLRGKFGKLDSLALWALDVEAVLGELGRLREVEAAMIYRTTPHHGPTEKYTLDKFTPPALDGDNAEATR